MITCINHENWGEYGALLQSQFKLRHKEFIDRQDYKVRTYEGMEYDQYDTPAAAYLVYHDQTNTALGVSRLVPTAQDCMLRDLWPFLVRDQSLLENAAVWEGTRYCIDKNVNPHQRRHIINEMAIAYLEFGLQRGIKKIIGMMPTFIYRSVFEKPGIQMEYLGDVKEIGRHKIRAVAIPVEKKQLENVRNKTGIRYRVLNLPDAQPSGYTYERAV
ncbi:MAG: autoinducer synthesis protein [Alphaproteobacteria bacterium]|nr:autoinducer synthesis protein [Alphaproteobacteria bacterium]MBU0859470.1 autoinducer synthesis protein [Alphaproteobacteria bacterium]